MTETKDRLRELEGLLTEGDAPVLKYLNPGVSGEELQTFFKGQNIDLNPALMALYEWHNGVLFPFPEIMQSELEILPMGIFYCLELLVKTREEVIGWNYMEDADDYIPLFGSGEDDLFLLKNSTGEIFYMSPAAENFGTLYFGSIDELLDFIIECYRENIITIDPEQGIDTPDYDLYHDKLENYKHS